MSEFSNINSPKIQEEDIDVKKYIYLILRQWYWFAIFGLLGLSIAFAYTRFSKQQYQVSTSILAPAKPDGFNMKDMFQGSFDEPSNNIYNQIEIIKSYYNVNKAILNLNWRTSWYKKDLLIWNGIYKYEPFDVQEGQSFVNPTGIPVYITPLSGDTYSVSVNSDMSVNGESINVKFEQNGTYGKPFANRYFNFTLLKKSNGYDDLQEKYYFVFNDFTRATRSYQNRLNVSLNDKNSDIILCSIQGEEPEREVDFLNELIQVYINGKQDLQNKAQLRTLGFINDQLDGISDSLNTAQNEYTNFRSRNSAVDIDAESQIVFDNLKEIETERVKSQMQLEYFQNLLTYLESNSSSKEIYSPSVVGIDDASLNALVQRLQDMYNRRQVMSFSAKDNNPAIIALNRELTSIKTQLTENLRNLIENAKKNISSQQERQARVNVQLGRLPQKEQQLVNIKRKAEITSEIYNFLLQKKAETNITMASAIPDIQVIDEARTETAKTVGMRSNLLIGLGFAVGAGLPMAFLLVFGYFDTRIRSQEDLEKNTRIPILGNVMHFDSKLGSELVVFENPKSVIAESFRALRTNLQFMVTGDSGKVISVHSTNPGEGKSFISDNLATVLAMNNKKVVLIGADLRKPRLHKIFETSNEIGLSTYLIGSNPINEIIQQTKIENLSLIPSGPIPPNPAEILSKTEMKQLIETLKRQFDYVVIDNAPTALVTDGQIVSALSDLNIFILRYGVSHKHQIEIINNYAERKVVENMAIVVNDIKANAFGHSYYKYYQYEAYQNSYYAEDKKPKKTKKKA